MPFSIDAVKWVELAKVMETYRIRSQVGHIQFGFQDALSLLDGLLTFADGADERPLGFRQHARHLGLLDLLVHLRHNPIRY